MEGESDGCKFEGANGEAVPFDRSGLVEEVVGKGGHDRSPPSPLNCDACEGSWTGYLFFFTTCNIAISIRRDPALID